MSRIGKYPIPVPAGTTVQVSGQKVSAKGKLGEIGVTLVDEVEARLEGDKVWVKPRDDSDRARVMWGTSRTMVRNVIEGVSKGFTRQLEINGVGYRAAIEGKNLKLQLGFSHDVLFPIPPGIDIRCDKPTSISVTGIDKQRVGQVASEIRGFKPPEPYKGKGIKYADETILRKEGKKK